MHKPKMIIFDYGHTLCYEPFFDGLRGTEAVLEYAVSNKDNLTAAEVNTFIDGLFSRFVRSAQQQDVEVHHFHFNRFAYEYLQIEFSVPQEQIEKVFWDNAAPGQAMPGAEAALEYLNSNAIRTGVISNISYSGKNLTDRIDRLLPSNKFKFIIASSEYMVRKPNPLLFELALRKAGLPASDVWYCGDSTFYDLAGARNTGVYPVWYHSEFECSYRDKNQDVHPEYEHLYIRNWSELPAILEGLA